MYCCNSCVSNFAENQYDLPRRLGILLYLRWRTKPLGKPWIWKGYQCYSVVYGLTTSYLVDVSLLVHLIVNSLVYQIRSWETVGFDETYSYENVNPKLLYHFHARIVSEWIMSLVTWLQRGPKGLDKFWTTVWLAVLFCRPSNEIPHLVVIPKKQTSFHVWSPQCLWMMVYNFYQGIVLNCLHPEVHFLAPVPSNAVGWGYTLNMFTCCIFIDLVNI